MGITPIYAFPFQGRNDPPDGAADNEALANAVETELVRLDATIQRRTGVRARRVANQSCSSSAVTNISFDTEDEDSDSFLTPHATTGTTFSIPANGIYSITFNATTAIFSSARSFVQLEFTSGITGMPVLIRNNFQGSEDNASVHATVRLDTGNSFKASVFHLAGSNQNFTAGLQCWRVSP